MEPTFEIKAPDGRSETVDLGAQRPINDPNCKHVFKKDLTDETPGFVAWVCTYCPVGYLAKKA